MASKPLNYTTTIPATRTMGEIQAMLAAHGAVGVATRYALGEPTAVQFALVTPSGQRAFDLPIDIDAMHQLLTRESNAGKLRGGMSRAVMTSRAHAARVAWRVVKDWLAAQLALTAAGMATVDQVMLPYLVVNTDGQTLYQRYLDAGMPALEAGS